MDSSNISYLLIEESELQHYHEILEKYAYSESDFEISEKREDGQPNATGIYVIDGAITIKSKKNGKEKTYDSGPYSSWPEVFEQDCKSGFFG